MILSAISCIAIRMPLSISAVGFAELAGGEAEAFFEGAAEIVDVGEAGVGGDFSQGQLPVAQ